MKLTHSRSSPGRTPSLALLLAVVAIGAVAVAPSGAPKVLNLWPDQFESSVGPQWGLLSPGILTSIATVGLGAPFSNVNCHALVELRNGRTIQGVTYYHEGHGSAPFTAVSLLRMQMGKHPEVLASGSSTQDTQPLAPNNIVPVNLGFNSANLTVEPGYRYYVTVNVDSADASVRGVQISYR